MYGGRKREKRARESKKHTPKGRETVCVCSCMSKRKNMWVRERAIKKQNAGALKQARVRERTRFCLFPFVFFPHRIYMSTDEVSALY